MSDRAPIDGGDEIHAIGYRRLHAPRPIWPGWPIARTLLVLAWRKRVTKLSLLMCLGVFVLHGGWLVVQLIALHLQGGFGLGGGRHRRRQEAAFDEDGAYLGDGAGAFGDGPGHAPGGALPFNAQHLVGQVHEVLASFVSVQFFATALVLAVVAAGAVADDRRTGAFELYFSRPLSRAQYVLGKLLGAALVPVGVLLVPQLLLWVVALGVSPPEVRAGLWWLGVPALAAAALACVTLATSVIGVSALGRRARNVGAVYIALLLLLTALAEGLRDVGFELAGYLSPERDLRTVVDALFSAGSTSLTAQMVNLRGGANADAGLALVALMLFNLAGLGLVVWRVRREVRAG